MRDWELVDSDRFSFEDSDRFEEDSLCSWISEPESLCNNWRGWKKTNFSNSGPAPAQAFIVPPGVTVNVAPGVLCLGVEAGPSGPSTGIKRGWTEIPSPFTSTFATNTSHQPQLNLVELSAKCVATHIPFEMVERYHPPVPEHLQLRIAFWSFPEYEEDIRLYSCLANGSADEFVKGERLFRTNSVCDILQIGFHLSATVKPNMREAHKVAVTFDRRRVTSCTCTCNGSTNWCGHVVAVCLHRIFQSKDVTLRAPVSESLSGLQRDQLQKFAQYLISELPQQILPTAQRLLDELLSSQRSAINTLRGAPDPTAGASANEQTSWYLDERTLHGNIHKILIKFCVPAPIVFSDVNYLTSAAPPASAEWTSLLRPLRGREPEGMWNLLSIVREMFRREDRNAVPLLEVITEECLNCDQILVWWFNTKVALHNGNSGHGGKHHSVNSNAHACQHAGSSLCDEIVLLWRLAALNPGLSPEERCTLHSQFKEWHLKIIEKISKSRNASVGKHANSFKNDIEVFPGFRPSIEACYLNWDNYPIPGITYSEASQIYRCPFMCFRHSDGVSRSGDTGLIHSSHAILNNPAGEHHLLHSSATISSAPMISKRPRSVDFGGERNVAGPSKASSSNSGPGPSSASGSAPGPSTSKSGKSGRNSKKRYELANDGGLGSMIPCMSASGLKIKSRPNVTLSLEHETSFEDELPTPGLSSTSSSSRSRVCDTEEQPGPSTSSRSRQLPVQRQGSIDGNRSSVSSEGFCENENEIETEASNDRDEGVEICELSIVASNIKLNTTATSDDFEDGDSDSSVSVRIREVDLQALANLQPDLTPKFDSSDSQQSGDEYQLYYYDPKASASGGNSKKNGNTKEADEKEAASANAFNNLKRIEDEWEVLFARAEGLQAHGHSKEACRLGVKLAQELLENPPDLSLDVPHPSNGKGKRKKINPISHQVSCLASATLAKCGFLCTVLAENSDYFYLAFQVGMFGLELARPPASTKPLEVKLANQEAELANLLKKIPIGGRELEMIRQKAEALRDGSFKSRGEALLPLVLSSFIFDALVMPANRDGRCSLQTGVYHLPTDESLGFEAAVSALGLKANVSEAEHPLLCEGTRRQRGELVLAMLLHYKDESEKVAKIMDKLLDRDIHILYKAPIPAAYYSNNPPTTTVLGAHGSKSDDHETGNVTLSPPTQQNGSQIPTTTTTPPLPPTQGNSSRPASTSAPASSGAAGSSETSGVRPQSTASAESDPGVSNSNTNNSPTTTPPAPTVSATVSSGTTGPSRKESGRYKGKRTYPVLPNQPSEAGAHFMFELGKIVLSKAGGSSNQSLFTQPSNGQNPRGPHRALHNCAFHIGLYALGLHNTVSPNWLSRTYSSHVSWITGQAMEIGAPAIVFLIDTWDCHLTPPEAVTIADRASRGDVNMVKAASELALSCLPHAHALNPNELHRAILQCKEQSDGMLEKACVTVEAAAKGGGVCPEVLFDVARQWFSLYQKHLPLDVDVLNEEFSHHDHFLILDSSFDPMNPNHQIISPQTGLPILNPNNPPPPGPSVSNSGASGPSSMDVLRLQQQQQQQQDSRPPPYPGMTPGLPYPGSYPPPFMAASFNPVPMAMYPQVIYQTSPSMNPGSGNGGYYAQQGNAYPGNQMASGPVYPNQPMHQMPSAHSHPHPHSHPHQHLSSLVSTGPALQYYTPAAGVPTISSAGGHLRQPAQFFPVAQMSLHHNGHGMGGGMSLNPAQGPPNGSHPHVAVMAHGHLPHGHHLVAIPTGNPNQNGQPIMLQAAPPGTSAGGHQLGHPMNMNMSRAPNGGQPQVNGMTSQHNGFGNQMSHPMGMHPNPNQMNCMGMSEIMSSSGGICGRDQLNHQQPMNGQSVLKVKYLLSTYRVGMLAMESLARSRDDRPTAKFSRNPLHGEDIKWVLSISRKLGAQYVQQFCICAMQSITNPYTLHEIILDAASISTRANLQWVYQNPRSPLAPLVQKCQEMYFQCLHQKLYHITASEYEDFVNIVCTARQAFHLTPEGGTQFKEWLGNLRRSKTCKKDLWSQLTQTLQSNPK